MDDEEFREYQAKKERDRLFFAEMERNIFEHIKDGSLALPASTTIDTPHVTQSLVKTIEGNEKSYSFKP